MYVPKTAVIDPSLLLDPISKCCIHLIDPRIEEDIIWKEFFDWPFEDQISVMHSATEVCHNLEMEWDTDDAADQNNRDDTVSQQHTMPGPSDSSSSWEGNKELCRTLSCYMMYLFVMRSSLLPIAASHDHIWDTLCSFGKTNIGHMRDARAACRYIFQHYSDVNSIVELLKSKQKDLRWETLKWMWVRMLCHAASKGQRNEHFRQLSQGGEFLTFLWFFLPQSKKLMILPPDLPPRSAVGENLVWKEFFDMSFEAQIVSLHIATEICYNLEMEWDAHDASENDRDSAVSKHTMPPSDSSLSWEEDKELYICRTLSHYMMYLLAMRPSLLPTSSSDDYVSDSIRVPKPDTNGLLDVKAACPCLWESDEFGTAKIIKEVVEEMGWSQLCNYEVRGRYKCVMDPIPALVRRLWDVWDLRLLVLLSLALQIILSVSGNRRKYISSPWISILIWSAYLTADWVATVALGKLSDAQGDYDNGNALRAIWAPLLLLHLGGPDTITAYSLEDNHLWMRHLLGLVVQLSVAVYIILMSWKHSWFSIMSILALVAGFIKYGERTWVLFSVSHDKSGEIVPVGNVGSGSNLGNNNTLEDNNSIRALCIAQRSVKAFKEFTRLYDIENNWLRWEMSLEHDDISLFWNAIEVEMGLMFDLLYTKAPINFSKGGWVLRCFTFSCTVAVLIGLILRLVSTGEDGDKWHKVDIVITGVLLVGALALEIYAIISLYLFSDWGMLWLIKHNRGKQVIQLRKKISWLFLPKQYRCKMMGQFDLLDHWLKKRTSVIEPDQGVEYSDQKAFRRILGSLLGIKRWLEEYFKDMFNKYVHKTADIVPSLLFDPILHCCRCLTSPDLHPRRAVEEDPVWKEFFNASLEEQISRLYFATGICYNLETEWDTHDAADDQNNRDGTVSQQHTMPPSVSSSSWEDNRELCRTLSRYMMYLLVMRSSLLPIVASGDYVSDSIRCVAPNLGGARDARAACKFLWESDEFATNGIVVKAKSIPKDERWDILKLMWVRMLCYAASKGQRNEHFRQLSQGGEFITFLWFFLPHTKMRVYHDGP
ncbi:hypothetical protein RHGRI_015097 [Rhododendron griersonianum]|uniref:DUF4220 domain-containing protein n=1 Tax=Rhododendron griersonianum TaxID=479676 RepID=A0AAV6KBZ8_9ERIC|nr:hypothetical protein RHGRI_015097 [Rhododendron griersonianum]